MNNDFFVGYLPTTSRSKTMLRRYVAVVLVICLGVGGLIAASQLASGEGAWDPGARSTTTGLLQVDPYPVLHLADGRSVLLVRSGKDSAEAIAASWHGQHVSVVGAPIDRGGWSMLELYRQEDVQAATPAQTVQPPVPQAGKQVTLHGEIVDSKCFLGVMKPGAGKVHRACAAMCLTGGMPPMLVVTDTQGFKYGYMLITQAGKSASLMLVADVAVPVRVTGSLEVRGELTYLRLADNGVLRLRNTAVNPLSLAGSQNHE